MTVFEKIVQLLDKHKIEYKLSEHELVKTSEEAAKVRGTEIKTGAKAMVAKDKDKYYLFILPGNLRIDWKKVKDLLSVKDIRLATVEEAENLTHLEMGCVPPFGNILEVEAYLDKKLLENEYVNFNPGSRVHSINMKAQDLVNLTNPYINEFTE